MKIDYYTKNYSKYMLWLDVPYRQAARHTKLGCSGDKMGLSRSNRIGHVALAILKCIPALGHVTTLIDTLANRPKAVIVRLNERQPYLRGLEHGKKMRKQIKEIYEPILAQLTQSNNYASMKSAAAAFRENIPPSIIQEMEGLAEGSKQSLEDVLLIHTFLDAMPGQYGCTAMARKNTPDKDERIAAANHSVRKESHRNIDTESVGRRNRLLTTPNTKKFKVLKTVNKKATIQSIQFDPSSKSIKISTNTRKAAKKTPTKFSTERLFQTPQVATGEPKESPGVQLYRNLDWQWYFLGQNTILLCTSIKEGKSCCRVTFPGYLGTLSGMNEDGLSLALCSNGSKSDLDGVPNPLLFTMLLESCENTDAAAAFLNSNRHGSSMNLIVADPESATSFELNGENVALVVGKI